MSLKILSLSFRLRQMSKVSFFILLASSSLDIVMRAIDALLSKTPGRAIWTSVGVSKSLNRTFFRICLEPKSFAFSRDPFRDALKTKSFGVSACWKQISEKVLRYFLKICHALQSDDSQSLYRCVICVGSWYLFLLIPNHTPC